MKTDPVPAAVPPVPPASAVPAATPLTDFAALAQVCCEEFDVTLTLGGNLVEEEGVQVRKGARPVSLKVRRLTSAESAQAGNLLSEVVPKRVRDNQAGEDRYDLLDVDYLKRRRDQEVLVRAWVLLCGVDLLRQGWQAHRQAKGWDHTVKPDRKFLLDAAGFFAEKFPEDLLERLRRLVESDTVDEEALADFFSTRS